MSTRSTDQLYATLVAGALAYTPPGTGVSLGTALSNRLYRQAPPRDAAYPYACLTLRSPQLEANTQELKERYHLEAMVFHRPRAAQDAAETIADALATYLRMLRDASSGLIYATDVTAESLPMPPAGSVIDGTVVQVRVAAQLHVWPVFISALTS